MSAVDLPSVSVDAKGPFSTGLSTMSMDRTMDAVRLSNMSTLFGALTKISTVPLELSSHHNCVVPVLV